MTPISAIAMLDRQIKAHGQIATLRRQVVNGAPVEVVVRVSMRGYRPEEITDGMELGASQVIVSPTQLKGTPFEAQADWPRKLDQIVICGRTRVIHAPDPVLLDDVLVRLNLTVAG